MYWKTYGKNKQENAFKNERALAIVITECYESSKLNKNIRALLPILDTLTYLTKMFNNNPKEAIRTIENSFEAQPTEKMIRNMNNMERSYELPNKYWTAWETMTSYWGIIKNTIRSENNPQQNPNVIKEIRNMLERCKTKVNLDSQILKHWRCQCATDDGMWSEGL